MTRIPLLLVALLALAGCTTDAPPGDAQDDVGDAPAVAGPIVLSVDAVPSPVPSDTVTVNGSVDREVTLTATLMHGTSRAPVATMTAEGAWSVTVAVPHGQSVLNLTADDGARLAHVDVPLVRLAPGTLQSTFLAAVPPRPDRSDAIEYDPDSFPSAALYGGCPKGVKHPGYYTVHDAMVVWEQQTDVQVEYGACGQFGFFVSSIDGHESPGFWCYTKNGSSDVLGVSGEPFSPGDTVRWRDCTLGGM